MNKLSVRKKISYSSAEQDTVQDLRMQRLWRHYIMEIQKNRKRSCS